MSIKERRINNVMKVMKDAKDYGMKSIWSNKLQQLFKLRERQAHERLQDSARSLH